MTKLIERNKTIPCKANETFTTNEGEQSRLLMIDLKFTEDKISWIIAYEKAIPPQE